MDDNTFWILIWILITPLGWMGLLFTGIAALLTGIGVGAIFASIRGRLNLGK